MSPADALEHLAGQTRTSLRLRPRDLFAPAAHPGSRAPRRLADSSARLLSIHARRLAPDLFDPEPRPKDYAHLHSTAQMKWLVAATARLHRVCPFARGLRPLSRVRRHHHAGQEHYFVLLRSFALFFAPQPST